MRKSARRVEGQPAGSTPGKPAQQQQQGSHGPWEFTSSGRLFAVGSTDAVRRAAYRTAQGVMRFLPL